MVTDWPKTTKVKALMNKMKTRKGLVRECSKVLSEQTFTEEVKIKVSGSIIWEEDDTPYVELDASISDIECKINETSKTCKEFQDRITAVLYRNDELAKAAGEDDMDYWDKVLTDAQKLPH